jgi:hypothetical protein
MTILQTILISIIGIVYIIWTILSIIDLTGYILNHYRFLDQSTKIWIFFTTLIILILIILSFKYGW